jgi:hypothetical protein
VSSTSATAEDNALVMAALRRQLLDRRERQRTIYCVLLFAGRCTSSET